MSKITIKTTVPPSKDIVGDTQKVLENLYQLYPGLRKVKNLKIKVTLNKVEKRNEK